MHKLQQEILKELDDIVEKFGSAITIDYLRGYVLSVTTDAYNAGLDRAVEVLPEYWRNGKKYYIAPFHDPVISKEEAITNITKEKI